MNHAQSPIFGPPSTYKCSETAKYLLSDPSLTICFISSNLPKFKFTDVRYISQFIISYMCVCTVCMYVCMYICMYLQSANEKLDLQVKEQLEKHIKLEVHTVHTTVIYLHCDSCLLIYFYRVIFQSM